MKTLFAATALTVLALPALADGVVVYFPTLSFPDAQTETVERACPNHILIGASMCQNQ